MPSLETTRAERRARLKRDTARRLRGEASEAERKLWSHLRRKQMALLRFRRQHPLGPYIVDFYCVEARLAIEVDGEIHAQPRAMTRDAIRERFLAENGHKVIHVNASDILKDADGVAASIGSLVSLPLHHAPHGPPPRAGEDQE